MKLVAQITVLFIIVATCGTDKIWGIKKNLPRKVFLSVKDNAAEILFNEYYLEQGGRPALKLRPVEDLSTRKFYKKAKGTIEVTDRNNTPYQFYLFNPETIVESQNTVKSIDDEGTFYSRKSLKDLTSREDKKIPTIVDPVLEEIFALLQTAKMQNFLGIKTEQPPTHIFSFTTLWYDRISNYFSNSWKNLTAWIWNPFRK